jgi:hypothetical protein
MSIYASPKLHNGSLNATFNNTDYIKLPNSGGSTLAQTDARYLRNSGIALSSANSTFSGTVDIGALCTVGNIKINNTATIKDINVSNLGTFKDIVATGILKSTQTSDTLTAEVFRADQTYSFTNGMVYSLISDATSVNSVSFINIPTTTNQSYIFTFILQPSTANSPYYIKSNNNTINVNGISTPLYGLQNISLPVNYTFLVQQISIIYDLYSANPPNFFALTSVSAY